MDLKHRLLLEAAGPPAPTNSDWKIIDLENLAVWLGLPMTQIFRQKIASPGVEPAPAAKRVQTARSLIFLLKKGGFFAVRGL